MLRAGQVIDRFELITLIGEGGMAHVWAACDSRTQQIVALKIVHSRFAEDPSFRAMFLDEAHIASAIRHPNVGRVFETGEHNGQVYLVMEYVDGESLFSTVSQYRAAPLATAIQICADVAAGLHAAHSLVGPDGQSRNVVHRDVSPQNVLLTLDGVVKVIDFGIAKARDRASATTALGQIKGKIRYMAPEQAQKKELGPWTDVFGVGATLFRLVVGRPPYSAENDISTMQALMQGAPHLVAIPAEVPAPVTEVIERAIAPSVADRYQTADDLRRALVDLVGKTGEKPDVVGWVRTQMSDKTRQVRGQLGLETPPAPAAAPVPELPLPNVTAKGTALMAPLPATTPDQKRPPLPPPPGALPGPSNPPKAGDPGFMDVHKLLAQANGVPDLPVPPKGPSGTKPMPQAPQQTAHGQGQLHAAPAAPEPQKIELAFEPSNRKVEKKTSTGPLRVAILVVGGVLLLFVFLVAVPLIAKSRAASLARESGFDLQADSVGVGWNTVHLKNVKLKATRVPGVTATIEQLDVNGFSVKELHAVGLTVNLDGNVDDWEMGLGLMLAENRIRYAGTAAAPRKYSVANGRITWKNPAGAGFDLTGMSVDIESRGNGNEDVHTSMEKLVYQTGKTQLGPWSGSFESSPASLRFRLAFDPAVPDGPSLLVVSTPASPVQITAKIGRSPFANLGLKPAELGLPADGSSEIDTSMAGTITPDGRVTLAGPTSLWGLRVKDVPKPINVNMVLSLSGMLGKPLDIDRTSSISFGPFVAQLTGTVTPDKGNVRLDALAKANAIPCNTFARAKAETMGNFVQMLSALGQTQTALRLTGAVNASVAVKWDSSAPDTTDITWVAKETCGLSIFGL